MLTSPVVLSRIAAIALGSVVAGCAMLPSASHTPSESPAPTESPTASAAAQSSEPETTGSLEPTTLPQPSVAPEPGRAFECAAPPLPPGESPRPERPPTVIDQTGLVVGCLQTDYLVPLDGEISVSNPFDDIGLEVVWQTGPCDAGMTFTFSGAPDGYELVAARHPPCDAVLGLPIFITFRDAVLAGSVDVSFVGEAPATPWPASPTPAPTTIPGSTDRDRLYAFWNEFDPLGCVGFPPVSDDWKSVGEMTPTVDLVVIGVPVSIDHWFDKFYGEPITVAVFDVEEVLYGDLKSRRHGAVEVISFWRGDPRIELIAGVEHVLFLDNFGDDERTRHHRAVSDDERFSYYTPSSYENVFANVGGRVVVPYFEQMWDSDTYPLPRLIDGTPFDDLVASVLGVAESTPLLSPPSAPQASVFAC